MQYCFNVVIISVSIIKENEMSNSTVLLAVADGSEEIELITLVDVLRRADVDVTMVSVMSQRQITGAHNVQLRADALMADVMDQEFDAIVLPGGMPGATHISECTALVSMLKEQQSRGELVAAICASPAVVLAKHGMLEGVVLLPTLVLKKD